MMKKILMLVVLVLTVLMVAGSVQANAIVVAVAVGSTASTSPLLVLGVPTVVTFVVLSPWIYQYWKYPACRGATSMGDMVECVKNLPINK